MATTYNPALDPYAQRSTTINSYSRDAFAVTPNDATNLAPVYAKALYVGVTGNVTVVPINAVADTDTVLFTAVPAGTILPIQVRRVMATGTTASGIIALVN